MKATRKNRRIVFLSGLAIVVVYLLPYYLKGQDTLIRIHDNLDSNLVWMKVLLDGGYFTDWSKTIVPSFMNGVPVSSLAPIYDISALCMGVFGMFWGYVACKTLMALTGYCGMWLLLRRFLIPREPLWIAGGVAVCYGILPFWGFGLGVAILPLFFWSFLNIRSEGLKAGWRPWLVMLLGGFGSSLILEGVFFIGICGLWVVFDAVFRKRNLWPSILALAALSVSYILSHIRIFRGFFGEHPVSHRVEMDFTYRWIGTLFRRANDMLIEGQYHAASLHTWFIPVIGVGLVLLVLPSLRSVGSAIGKDGARQRTTLVFINLLEFLILSSLWYGLVNWGGANWFFEPVMKIIPLQLGRIHFLDAVVWYSLLALALAAIAKLGKVGKSVVGIILLFQIIYLFPHFEERFEKAPISYRGFYSESLFTQLKAQLGDPATYRVISVGMHPAIAQYNGFYTLDGYCADYPLAYKHQFRKLVAGELEKSPLLAHYYAVWGSRAYAFSAQIGKQYIFPKGNGVVLDGLDYDWEVFDKMGGRYIFAPFAIEDGDLELIGIFGDSESTWEVYVYEVVGLGEK